MYQYFSSYLVGNTDCIVTLSLCTNISVRTLLETLTPLWLYSTVPIFQFVPCWSHWLYLDYTILYQYFSSYLVGITNCTWTSCRHGCTSEIFKCWHVVVNVSLVAGSRPIPPPWASISSLALPPPPPNISKPAKLYPNVKGCGYPPKLQCEGTLHQYLTLWFRENNL